MVSNATLCRSDGDSVSRQLRDMGVSVRARLLERARAERTDFQLLLTRYVLERLLYRLMQRCPGVLKLLITVLLLCSRAISQPQTGDKEPSIRVYGNVVGPLAPVENATVTLQATGQDWSRDMQTDARGHFSFLVSPHAHYVLQLAIPRFVHWGLGVDVADKDVDLGNVGVQPPPPIRISGKLMDSTGKTVADQEMVLEPERQGPPLVERTQPDGSFLFDAVPPDLSFTLRVTAEGINPLVMSLPIRESNVTLGSIVLQTSQMGAMNQPVSSASGRNTRVFAQIIDGHGKPPFKVVCFRDRAEITTANESGLVTVPVDADGTFVLPLKSKDAYDIFPAEQLTSADAGASIGQIIVAGNEDLNIGTVLVTLSSAGKLTAVLTGSAKVTPSVHAIPARSPSQPARTTTIAALFAGSASPAVIILSDGTEVRPQARKEQIGISSPAISTDSLAAGWLMDTNFCCTSYPIDLEVFVFKVGQPTRFFTGDGRAIFRWHFVEGGKRVAFYQDFLHGTSAPHYELRDVASGRLVAKWDSDLSSNAPVWTKKFR